MADDRDDAQRTEEPTQRRLDEAAKHGDIVKSTEVTTFVVLLGGTLTIAMFGHAAVTSFTHNFVGYIEQPDQMPVDAEGVLAIFKSAMFGFGALLAAPLALISLMGLGGHVLQARPSFVVDRIAPDLSKLSLIKGLGRMFGLEGLANLAKGVVKLVIVGAVLWIVLWPERNNLEATMAESPQDIAAYMVHLLMKILIGALSVLAVIAAGDYFLQRYRFLARNRMSKQEIKEELRQTDGDPAMKAKIRQMRLERAKRRMMAAVPKATVVIMNPTHYAVALKYESGKMAAPVCVAKGVDAVALRIRDVAEENDVPVVENAPLARALYAAVDLDETVPTEHFKAVAQVIGYVMRLSGQIKARS